MVERSLLHCAFRSLVRSQHRNLRSAKSQVIEAMLFLQRQFHAAVPGAAFEGIVAGHGTGFAEAYGDEARLQ